MKKQQFFDKNYLKKAAIWIAVSVISLGVVAYMSYHLASGFKKDVKTMFARRTTLQSTVVCDGYIFREEEPISADSLGSGTLYSVLEDGEKVRTSDRVADVYSVYSADAEKKLAAIDRQISLLENCRTLSLKIGDTGTVDGSILDTVTAMRRASEAGDLSKNSSLSGDLFLKMKKRDVLTGEITDFTSRIAELEAEKERLRSSLGVLVSTVVSPASGYYYSGCDGYERRFSSKIVDSLSLSSLGELIASEPDPVTFSAGKVVTSHKWYLACPMTREDASGISGAGSIVTVILQNNPECPLDMKVCSVQVTNSGALAVFLCDEVKEGFDFTRSQSVTVITGETTGFKVPVSAVRVVDGVEGVYIIDEIKVEFRRIDVIEEAGGFYLCREVTAEQIAAQTESESTAETSSDPAGTEDEEKGPEDEKMTAEDIPWLKQNDLIIISGTGVSEGVTQLPPRK